MIYMYLLPILTSSVIYMYFRASESEEGIKRKSSVLLLVLHVDETGLHGFVQTVSCAKASAHLVYSRNMAL